MLPHDEGRIPLGTLPVDDYLDEVDGYEVPEIEVANPPRLDTKFPCRGPGDRYQAVLYIEKEGFEPVLREAGVLDRFNIAVASCKGQSVVAARRLVDELCGPGGVPLLVVHDFDKSGFEIVQSLVSVSRAAIDGDRVKYRFQNDVQFVDLGLRLADVDEWGLESERCTKPAKFKPDSLATAEEQKFLLSGRRVELNAFTSPDFVKWLETKLRENGIDEEFVPVGDVLEATFRRAVFRESLNTVIREQSEVLAEQALESEVPSDLRTRITALLRESPGKPWDKVLAGLVRDNTGGES